MRRKVAAVWVSLLIMVSSVVVLVEIADRVEAPTTLYVGGAGGGDYSKIQWAIDNASDGDTVYVYNGTYYENVVVDKTINFTGEDRGNTIIDGGGSGSVIQILTNWANVSGFSTINGNEGIRLGSSSNNKISYNNVLNNGVGIYLYRSTNNTIANNNASNNNFRGIYLISLSKHNIIFNNTISTNTYYGVSLTGSEGNIIANNTISLRNKVGIYLSGAISTTIVNNEMMGNGIGIPYGGLAAWNTHIIDSTNTVNDKPVYYWKNQTGGTVPPGAGQVILANCTNVVVENQNVSDGTVGIKLGHSSNNTITNNTGNSNKWFGIYLYSSSNNNIDNNTVSSNTDYGIFIRGSSDSNNIVDNIALNNIIGIYLLDSKSNTVTNNEMVGDGIFISGALRHWNTHFIDTTNTVNGKPVYYWKNQTGGTVPPGAGQVILANCTNVIVENQNVSDGSVGIQLGFSESNTVANNTASLNNWCGINLDFSHTNTIASNNASNNVYGIYLDISGGNNITHNNVSDNDYGIFFPLAYDNTIVHNTISSNKLYGIYSEQDSYNNIFYHNNIINNTNQADDNTDFSEDWDIGYPLGGNYWSDYSGNDNFKGPNQDIPGSDGIGDTPYILDFNSWDSYPHMQPYNPIENYTILKLGWNLISIPFKQVEQNLTRVLGSIDSWYDAVQWYDVLEVSDPWKDTKIGKPFGNELDTITESIGFWIHITQPGDTIFIYNGTEASVNQTIDLSVGWNMVGYPSLSIHNRTFGLNNLTFDTHIDCIQWFDAATKTWHLMGPDDSFVPGRGYWVHSKVDVEWEVPI
jgi:parallel beta-helix repeat protein